MVGYIETTPTQCWNPSPLQAPAAPRVHSRVALETTRRVMDNLDTLCVPSFHNIMEARSHHSQFSSPLQSPSKAQSPMFDAGMQRMRDGSALQRLRAQRDADIVRQHESMDRLKSLSMTMTMTMSPVSDKKGLSNPQVHLGRQASEQRRSGLARSA